MNCISDPKSQGLAEYPFTHLPLWLCECNHVSEIHCCPRVLKLCFQIEAIQMTTVGQRGQHGAVTGPWWPLTWSNNLTIWRRMLAHAHSEMSCSCSMLVDCTWGRIRRHQLYEWTKALCKVCTMTWNKQTRHASPALQSLHIYLEFKGERSGLGFTKVFGPNLPESAHCTLHDTLAACQVHA